MKTLGSPAFLCFTSACRSRAQPSSHRKLPKVYFFLTFSSCSCAKAPLTQQYAHEGITGNHNNVTKVDKCNSLLQIQMFAEAQCIDNLVPRLFSLSRTGKGKRAWEWGSVYRLSCIDSTPHSWRHKRACKALLDWYSDKQHALSLKNTLLESSLQKTRSPIFPCPCSRASSSQVQLHLHNRFLGNSNSPANSNWKWIPWTYFIYLLKI